MSWLLMLPFGIQAVAMAFDEFYFHHRRGLPRWERLGHPLDTITFMACYAWILLVPPESWGAIAGYAGLAIFSSAFITKDEFIHAETCGKGEHLTHGLLFAFHAFVLIAAGLIWPALHLDPGEMAPEWLRIVSPKEVKYVVVALLGHMVATAGFFLYQVGYWNLIRRQEPAGTQ